MSNTITIQEETPKIWKNITYAAGIFMIIFGLIFWNSSDPLWAGIYRLIAFICFSLSVFGVLKQLGSPLKLIISHTPEYLLIEYQQKNKTVQEEQFERSTIKEFLISKNQSARWIIKLFPITPSATLTVCFTDTHRNLPLFEYSGRTLFFDRSSIQEVKNYLSDQNIAVSAQK